MADDYAALSIDSSEVVGLAVSIGASIDQVPFAMSVALNKAAGDVREILIDETWPRHVRVRNRGFMRRALRRVFSSKTSLTVSIYDDLGRANLNKHALGGVVSAKGGKLAIPASTSGIVKTDRGVVQWQRPAVLPRSFRKGDLIFQNPNSMVQRGASGKPLKGTKRQRERIKLMYVLKSSVTMKADVPFYETFGSEMTVRVLENLPDAIARAMRSAKVRQV